MREYFPDGVARTTLTNKVVEMSGISNNTAKVRVFRTIRKGLLRCDGSEVFLA